MGDMFRGGPLPQVNLVGRRCQSNVANRQDKLCLRDYFSIIRGGSSFK